MNMNNNVSYDESVAELKSGKTLKYRILKVKKHIRVKDVKGNLIWQDVERYIGQRIVPTGWFTRGWETITFKDEYGEKTYFNTQNEIIDWFKYLDGDTYEVVKLYSSNVK